MKSKVVFLVAMLFLFLSFSYTYSEVPKMINYQGKITRPTGALMDTTTSMVFSIYADSTGGTSLWTETQTSVKVEYGVFSVLLGSVNPIPESVFEGHTRYMGLKVGADLEMTPRRAIVSVGYAFKTEYSDTAEYARTAPAMPDSDWTINGNTIYHLNGNVGIGTTTPEAPLMVKTSASWEADGSKVLELRAWHSSSAPGSGVRIDFTDSQAQVLAAQIRTQHESEGGRVGLSFHTLDGTVGERVRILGNGNVGIGTTSPQGALDVTSTTGALIVPRMTTAQRDALTAVNGMIIYNTTTNEFNFYENGAWVTK